MKKLIIKSGLLSALLCVLAVASCAMVPAQSAEQVDAQRSAVVAVVQRYGKALNAADTGKIASLYTKDAVFMPQHIPAVVGLENVKGVYRKILGTIRLNIEFAIDEVHVAVDWAWVRTRSAGTITVLKSGATHPEKNQELFLLRRDSSGEWKIARYIFTSTLPRAG